jgi:hypothetical protein
MYPKISSTHAASFGQVTQTGNGADNLNQDN